MNFLELIKELETTPIISGSQSIGWIAKYHKPGDKGYYKADFPAGTPYITVIETIQKAAMC